jgi:hypothetical protein
MPAFAILTNRKRALIAQIHAAAFLGLAIRDFAISSRLSGILAGTGGTGRSIAFGAIYLVVAVVLGYLLSISKCANEQLYFGLCTASASTGMLRALVGDSGFPAGQYLRMGLLAGAVMTGLVIVRLHSARAISAEESCVSAGEGSDL